MFSSLAFVKYWYYAWDVRNKYRYSFTKHKKVQSYWGDWQIVFLSLVTSKNVFTIVIDQLENNTGDHSCYFEQYIPSQHQRIFTSP